MHLYSHLVIAHAMLAECQPVDLAEYYWGAVAPDIRYLAGLRRRATHLPVEMVRAWSGQRPALRDFALGYLVHILSDERDGAGALYDPIPLRAVRRRLPRPLAAVLLEAAYAERVRLEVGLSGTYNPILAELGVPEAAAAPFAAVARRYAAAPSFAAAMSMLGELGLAPGGEGHALPARKQTQLARYLRIAHWLEGHPRVRQALIERVDVDGVTRRIVADIRNFL
jgi:hypothetical protein